MKTITNMIKRACAAIPPLIRRVLLPVFTLALLCNCATIGNKSIDDPKKLVNIREGVSHKEQVYASFGQPSEVDYSQDHAQSVWTYYKIDTSPTAWSYVPYIGVIAGGINKDTTQVSFFFGSGGKLFRMQTGKTSDSINSWVGIAKETSHTRQEARRATIARVEQEMQRLEKPFDSKRAKQVASFVVD
jgi:hypothetical protein